MRLGSFYKHAPQIARLEVAMIQSPFSNIWFARLSVPCLFAVTAVGLTAAEKEVTFSKDVAPIFQRACQNCHRSGSIAPMSLLTYQEARPWARSIKEKVIKRQMPPWHIDRNIGISKFKDDPSLTDAEIAIIERATASPNAAAVTAD